MLHGSGTWGPNASELQLLRRNDRSMARWICGVSAQDDIPSDQLLEKLGLADITTVLRCGRLRWSGHVERAPSNTGIGMVGILAVERPQQLGKVSHNNLNQGSECVSEWCNIIRLGRAFAGVLNIYDFCYIKRYLEISGPMKNTSSECTLMLP